MLGGVGSGGGMFGGARVRVEMGFAEVQRRAVAPVGVQRCR